MLRRFLIMIGLFALVSCGGATTPTIIPTTIPPTSVPTTPPIDLATFDFNTLLSDDDLPAGFTFESATKPTASKLFESMTPADMVLYRGVLTKKQVNGGVTFFAYKDRNKASTAYKDVLDIFENDPAIKTADTKRKKVDVGEKAETMTTTFPSINMTNIQGVFLRCNVVAYVVFGTDDIDATIEYMKALDAKVKTSLCTTP